MITKFQGMIIPCTTIQTPYIHVSPPIHILLWEKKLATVQSQLTLSLELCSATSFPSTSFCCVIFAIVSTCPFLYFDNQGKEIDDKYNVCMTFLHTVDLQ